MKARYLWPYIVALTLAAPVSPAQDSTWGLAQPKFPAGAPSKLCLGGAFDSYAMRQPVQNLTAPKSFPHPPCDR
jgi:hypothetical protein